MMTDETMMFVLERLKKEGISYKYVAKISNICNDTFYFYRRCKHFPLNDRIAIEKALREHFGEYIDEYCK